MMLNLTQGLFHTTGTTALQLPLSFMQNETLCSLSLNQGSVLLGGVFSFVFLGNPSLPAAVFVPQLNSAFAHLLQPLPDLSARFRRSTTALHFYCSPVICIPAALVVCIIVFLTRWILPGAPVYHTELVQRPEHRTSILVSLKSHCSAPVAFTSRPNLQLLKSLRQVSKS